MCLSSNNHCNQKSSPGFLFGKIKVNILLLGGFSSNGIDSKLEPIELEIDIADVVSGVVGTIIGVWYVMTKHWISNNILGLSFSVQGIAMLSLSSFQIGSILLVKAFPFIQN